MSDTMNRRQFLKTAGLGAAVLTVPSWISSTVLAERKPNIIVIVADDLGYGELGSYGGKEIPAPHIDSIGKNGVRFTNGYVSCPVCSPTRAGLLTGRYQQRFGHELNPGMPGNAVASFGLPLSETMMPARLKSAGYVTGMVGKWHLGYSNKYYPTDRGFDEFFGFLGGAHGYFGEGPDEGNHMRRGTKLVEEKEYLTDAFGRESVAFIEKNKDKPFFLYLAFNAVHSPLQASEKYLKRFASIKDEKRRTYAAMQSAMDDAVGVVLDTIRKNKLEEDTLIFFISDNGGPTRGTTSGNGPLHGYKSETYEGGIRVPYMVQWKGQIPAGQVIDTPVISLDIMPTACALAGASTQGAKFDGVDILPLLKTGKGTPHDVLYWRYGEQFAIRKGDWKFMRGPEGVNRLFNLKDDIGEKNDLSSTNREKVKELKALYAKWDSELIAPLWKREKPAKEEKAKAGEAGTKKKQKEAAK